MKQTPELKLKIGLLVEHPKRPEWGPGKVVAVSDDRIHVVFRDALERKAKSILRSLCTLRAAKDQSDAVLDILPAVREDNGDWLLPTNYDRLMKKALAPQPARAH